MSFLKFNAKKSVIREITLSTQAYLTQLQKESLERSEKAKRDVAEKYELLEDMVSAVFTPDSEIKYLLVSGAPGLGKSYTVYDIFKKMNKVYPDMNLIMTKGHVTQI